MEKINYLFENEQVRLIQRKDMFNFSLDTILLARFASLTKNVIDVVDFGTNNGAIPIFLAHRSSKLYIKGVEIQEEACDLAKRNVSYNELDDRIEIIHQSIQDFSKPLNQAYDLVLCNPPFFKVGATKDKSENESLLIARHEVMIDLESVIACASRVLKNKGSFCIVHRPERLEEIMLLLDKYQLVTKRIQLVQPRINQSAHTVLVEAKKQGNVGVKFEPTLIVHEEDGSYTETVKELFRRCIDETTEF